MTYLISKDQNNRVVDVFDDNVHVDQVATYPITDAEFQQISSSGRHGDFIYSNGVIAYSPLSKLQAQIRAESIVQIDKERDAAINAGYSFNGQLFHADALFQTQIQAFLLAWATGLLAPTATVSIRRKDNVTVQMGQAEVSALAAGLMQFVQTVYAQSWASKDALQ